MNNLKNFIENKSNIVIQFAKYGVVGGMAVATHLICFSLLNETVLPAGVDQASALRGWNFLAANTIAFCVANLVAYLANRAWVFQAGRHGQLTEVLLFFAIAAAAFFVGTPLGSWLVAHYPVNEYFVYAFVVATSIAVNFLGRKFLVFLH